MTSALSPEARALPLVAVVSKIPILAEALAAALDTFAEVQHFPAGGADSSGMLRYLRPDVAVVDNDQDLASIEQIAREQGFTVLAVGLADRTLRVLEKDGRWTEPVDPDPSAEVIRNIILGHLFARKAGR
jgi:hypothetical protein